MAILILAYRNNTMIRSSIICSQSSKHKLFVLRIIGSVQRRDPLCLPSLAHPLSWLMQMLVDYH